MINEDKVAKGLSSFVLLNTSFLWITNKEMVVSGVRTSDVHTQPTAFAPAGQLFYELSKCTRPYFLAVHSGNANFCHHSI